MTSTFALSPTRRPPLSRRGQSRLLIAAALLIAVLITEAVVVVHAAANVDITSLYITTT